MSSFSKRMICVTAGLCLLWVPDLIGQAAPTLAEQLDKIDNPAAGAAVYTNASETEKAIDDCYKPGIKTEFDNSTTVLERAAKAPCRFVGVTTLKARGDELHGDVIRYDAESEKAYWELAQVPGSTLLYGQVASPLVLPSKVEDKDLSAQDVKNLKALREQAFLLVELYGGKDATRSYEATNGFGAKTQVGEVRGERWSIAVNIGKPNFENLRIRIASASIPRSKAAELFPFLDVKLYWVAHRPCSQCLFGGSVPTGNHGPTFSSPLDVKLTQHFVFASFVAVRFVDRRDGSTIAISTGGQ